MQLKKTIQIDMADRGNCQTLGEAAVSGDSSYRALAFALMEDGAPWTVPEGVWAALAFQTDWGAEGEYDTLPDGTLAAVIRENTVTMRLIDSILARPGSVTLSLVLRDGALGRLSSHPMVMTVSQGLGDVPGTPERYYRVRYLDEINSAVDALTEQVDAVDTDANRLASQQARQAAIEARQYAASVDTQTLNRRIGEKGDDLYFSDGRLCLTSNGEVIGQGIELPQGGGMPTIVASQDVLFLPSAVEVGFQSGVVPYCNEVDPMAETAVLPWFTDTSSRVRKQYNGTGSVQTWHLRSPVSSSAEGFVAVYHNGAENHNYSANMQTFVSWVCCMGGACV